MDFHLAALILAIFPLVTVCVVRRYLIVAKVNGSSMEPTLLAGDRVLVWKNACETRTLDRIVVVQRPRDLKALFAALGSPAVGPDLDVHADGRFSRLLIKRVARVAGASTDTGPEGKSPECGSNVPKGHLYLLGDNPEQSYDSRSFGYVPPETVVGIALCRIAKDGRWGRIE
ncbi:signal peptidase I [Streptosporangium soli]